MAILTQALIPFLIGMMLVTGVCNTLLTKYQDLQCVRNCDAADPDRRVYFEQPVVQTAQMFVGEMGCWLVVGAHALWKWVGRKRGGSVLSRGEYVEVPAEVTDGEPDVDSDEVEEAVAKVAVADADGRRPLKGWRVILLALPACCDIAGTTLMNVGLLFVAASIYQMTRGALVLFVGLFSVIFLRRRLRLFQWVSLLIVVVGVGIVGLAGWIANKAPESTSSSPSSLLAVKTATVLVSASQDAMHTMQTPEALRTIIGVLLIAGAQVFTATQFVLEEYILERYALEPLKVVGWEGLFGTLVTVLGMLVLHVAIGSTPGGQYGYFDAREGWREIIHNKAIAVSSLLIMISIGGFNFFGLSVTRSVSATSRSLVDTCRTLFIWMVSLGLGWETFKWLQIVGFALLVYGTFLFNGIVRPPVVSWLCGPRRLEDGVWPDEDDGEEGQAVDGEAAERERAAVPVLEQVVGEHV